MSSVRYIVEPSRIHPGWWTVVDTKKVVIVVYRTTQTAAQDEADARNQRDN